MDWFDPNSDAAAVQVEALNHALKLGGRVLLRSAGLKPWYISVFEKRGFSTQRVAVRLPGSCIDRYVSDDTPVHNFFCQLNIQPARIAKLYRLI